MTTPCPFFFDYRILLLLRFLISLLSPPHAALPRLALSLAGKDIINDYFDKASKIYAPVKRDGNKVCLPPHPFTPQPHRHRAIAISTLFIHSPASFTHSPSLSLLKPLSLTLS